MSWYCDIWRRGETVQSGFLALRNILSAIYHHLVDPNLACHHPSRLSSSMSAESSVGE